MSNEQEPPMTVNAAVSALVKDLVTDRMSTLTMLLYRVDAAADALDRITEAALAALPPGACAHDALWIDDVEGVVHDLREAHSEARYDAEDAVGDLRKAVAAEAASKTQGDATT